MSDINFAEAGYRGVAVYNFAHAVGGNGAAFRVLDRDDMSVNRRFHVGVLESEVAAIGGAVDKSEVFTVAAVLGARNFAIYKREPVGVPA